MIFTFDERPSDSPFVERIWRAHGMRAGTFTSLAASHWEIVVMRHSGTTTVTVRGPETKATPVYCSVQAEWVGIIFRLGSFMPQLLASDLVDGSIDLPAASRTSFWLHGSMWPYPDYDNAETFVNQLVRQGLLVDVAFVQDKAHSLSYTTQVDKFERYLSTENSDEERYRIGVRDAGWGYGGSKSMVLSVRARHGQTLDGWNKGSGDAFAAPFAQDADFVAFDGSYFKGRQEMLHFTRCCLTSSSKAHASSERSGACAF
ncbi:MAG TPA: hypothetical protein VGJ87_00690 [Roseiflexaceae bacterium]|jgi:hypothetical protein